jgi:hypothetical protein
MKLGDECVDVTARECMYAKHNEGRVQRETGKYYLRQICARTFSVTFYKHRPIVSRVRQDKKQLRVFLWFLYLETHDS